MDIVDVLFLGVCLKKSVISSGISLNLGVPRWSHEEKEKLSSIFCDFFLNIVQILSSQAFHTCKNQLHSYLILQMLVPKV